CVLECNPASVARDARGAVRGAWEFQRDNTPLAVEDGQINLRDVADDGRTRYVCQRAVRRNGKERSRRRRSGCGRDAAPYPFDDRDGTARHAERFDIEWYDEHDAGHGIREVAGGKIECV